MKPLPVSEYISDGYYDDLQRPQGEPDLVWLLCLQLLSSWRLSASPSGRRRHKMTQSLVVVNQSTYREPTKPLFIKVKTLILEARVDLQTIQIIHKAKRASVTTQNPKVVLDEREQKTISGEFVLFAKTPRTYKHVVHQ